VGMVEVGLAVARMLEEAGSWDPVAHRKSLMGLETAVLLHVPSQIPKMQQDLITAFSGHAGLAGHGLCKSKLCHPV
jgi:hypothetical protein